MVFIWSKGPQKGKIGRMSQAENILGMALDIGFDLAGLAPFRTPSRSQQYGAWIDQGRHASMGWMETNRPLIEDPTRFMAEGKTLLMVGLSHSRPPLELQGGGRVARYAAGRDYHNWMGKRLKRLAKQMVAEGLIEGARSAVDAVPLMERSHAEEAGLGFASKAANLLHPRFGPWFFLGELVLEIELEPTPAQMPAGSCGTCTACLDACPTGALVSPGELDARLCLSWATIEQRGSVPHELRRDLGEWVFGCDICSEVCPWGTGLPSTEERFPVRPEIAESSLVDWLRLDPDPEVFKDQFSGMAVRRAGREGLSANSALVLGNHPQEEGRGALQSALEQDPSPKVRESAAWALLRGHGKDHGVQAGVAKAIARESDPGAQAAMERSLELEG